MSISLIQFISVSILAVQNWSLSIAIETKTIEISTKENQKSVEICGIGDAT